MIPATTSDVEPDPLQSSTFTGTIDTPFATPHVVPPIVPATWVPWPSQSFAPVPSPKSTANDDVMRPAVQRTGLWEPGETAVLRQLVKPSCRILDVGAHIGYFSVVAHRAVPGVVIDAVEPAGLDLFAAGPHTQELRRAFATTVREAIVTYPERV